MSSRIAIVTLARDNVRELELTLKSVRLQSQRPALHLVVDGSTSQNSNESRELCKRFEAEYVWAEPEGIYEAMEYSLSRLGTATHVWWLNSSDWLATRNALASVTSLLNRQVECSWVVGELIRREKSGLRFHKTGPTGTAFLRLMNLGFTGFPHPSTIFEIEKVRQVGGYKAGLHFRVADDYDLALRFGRAFGPPKMLGTFLSFHVPSGFSATNKLRGFVERIGSRFLRLPIGLSILSLLLLIRHIPFALMREKNLLPRRTVSATVVENRNIDHFCPEGTPLTWPKCCDEFLGVSPAE